MDTKAKKPMNTDFLEKLEIFQDLMKRKKSKIKPPDLIKLTKDRNTATKRLLSKTNERFNVLKNVGKVPSAMPFQKIKAKKGAYVEAKCKLGRTKKTKVM
jgi:hypothetical protein|tara:strand:+ start:473 stop:772 length:300 start_codon:yes stop_codon:yes gene_type:complete